ncbi:MAG TPA: hypothetical protein VGM91_00430 [Conexibacter sp.]|jgi:hypothetical protein
MAHRTTFATRLTASALTVVALAVGSGAAASAADAKASIRLTPGCFLSNDSGQLTGSGFEPSATWTAKLSGTHELGGGTTTADGRIRARFTAPFYNGTQGTRELTLSVTDGPNVASTKFLMSPLTASFSPQRGNPATMRVRWRVLGIGPDRGVYVHYVQPNGKLKRTIRIGTSDDVCGSLKTGPIALFPFKYSFGTWTFQVDASPSFSTETTPRLAIRFVVAKPTRRGGRAPSGRTPTKREGDANND